MSKPIHLCVSSSPELQGERATVGQVVAGLPLTIGWRIDHTPMPGEFSRDPGTRVAECDLYALILGHDFAAPMGLELRRALDRGLEPMAFWKRCNCSPSARDALRQLGSEWHIFASLGQLRTAFLRRIVHALLQRGTRLGLHVEDVERLVEQRNLWEGDKVVPGETDSLGEAGAGGVILGREIWDTDRPGPQARLV